MQLKLSPTLHGHLSRANVNVTGMLLSVIDMSDTSGSKKVDVIKVEVEEKGRGLGKMVSLQRKEKVALTRVESHCSARNTITAAETKVINIWGTLSFSSFN